MFLNCNELYFYYEYILKLLKFHKLFEIEFSLGIFRLNYETYHKDLVNFLIMYFRLHCHHLYLYYWYLYLKYLCLFDLLHYFLLYFLLFLFFLHYYYYYLIYFVLFLEILMLIIFAQDFFYIIFHIRYDFRDIRRLYKNHFYLLILLRIKWY